ncbi:MAG: site-specific integrase [Candidatus Omnitrophota bacterium]
MRESTNSSNKKFAETVLAKRIVEVAEGRFLDIKRVKKIKFDDFANEYLELHSKLKKSYYTDCKIVNLLKKYFSGKYLYEITSLDVEKLKSTRAKEVSPATVNRALAVLKSMFNRAIVWGKVEHNPCRAVKMFKENNQRLRFLEKEEIDKLLANCCEHLKPIVIVALHTGMRKSEILGLKWRDVDIEHKTIHLLDTKNGEKRDVPMNSVAIKTIISVPKHKDSFYIFCNQDGEPYGDIKKSWLTAVKKACIIDFHFHDLRHTFASQLVMSGVDLNTVRELLGHKSLEMTIRYSHLSPDHKKKAVDILSYKIGSKSGTNLAQMTKIARTAKESSFDKSLINKEI